MQSYMEKSEEVHHSSSHRKPSSSSQNNNIVLSNHNSSNILGNPNSFQLNTLDEAFLDDFSDFPDDLNVSSNHDGRVPNMDSDADIFGYMRPSPHNNDTGQMYDYIYPAPSSSSSSGRRHGSSGNACVYQPYQASASSNGQSNYNQQHPFPSSSSSFPVKKQAVGLERHSSGNSTLLNDGAKSSASAKSNTSSGQSIGSHSDSSNSVRSRGNDPLDPKKKVADKKRQDRNSREQQRSFKISKQIDQLKQLLEDSGFKVKNSKYDILAGVTSYVKQLQSRSSDILNDIRSMDQQISSKSANIIPQDPAISTQSRTTRTNHDVSSTSTTSSSIYPKSMISSASTSSNCYPDPFKPIAATFSDRNFRVYFMQSPMALALAATDGRIFECNQAFQDITGLQKEHVLHASIFKLVDPEFLQEAYINIGLLLKQHQPPSVSYSSITAPSVAVVASSSQAIDYASGQSNLKVNTSDYNPSTDQRSFLKNGPQPLSSSSSEANIPTSNHKRSRSTMDGSSDVYTQPNGPSSSSSSSAASETSSFTSADSMNTSPTKSFYVKSLIISAYDGKNLNMAIGVMMPERNSHPSQNSFYPTSIHQSCFSVALVPSSLE